MTTTKRWRKDGSLYSLIMSETYTLQGVTIALGLAIPPCVVIPLEMQKRIVDEAIPAGDYDLLFDLAIVFAIAIVAVGALKFGVFYLRGWISEIVARFLRVALIDAQRRRKERAAHKSLGVVTSVITTEVEPLGGFAAEALNTPLIQGGSILGVVGFMFVTEPVLAAIGIIALAAEAFVTPILQEAINRLTRKRILTLRRAGLDMIEAADPPRHRLIVDAVRETRRTYDLRLKMNILKALLKVIRNLIAHAADIAVLIIGGWMVVQGQIGLGVIVAFLAGLRELRDPWSDLVSFYRRWTDARVKYRLVVGAMNGEKRLTSPAISQHHPSFSS
ncbi:MAG: ABC transporter transmembrane domain-containing protein [Pseudomonadota bacterium]